MNKVFFLIPTLSIGGGERVVSEMSLNLPESIERKIVLFKKEVSYPYRGEVISLNIPLPLKNPLLKIYYYFLGLLRFRKIIKAEKPNYVISFGHPSNIINILSGARAIVRVEGFLSESCYDLGGRIYKFFVKRFFNKAYIVVDVSGASAKDLIENFGVKPDKIRVIYNPLNIKEIEKLAKEPLEPKYQKIFENPVIINIGRLTFQKNHRGLINAFLKLKEKVKDVKLVILGQGELGGELKELSKRLGLDKDIYFMEWQKNPFKYLAKSKVFVLSSYWEGLPYVLLEAMACGLPVVSYDCKSGPREILAPNTSFSFQTKDIEYSQFGVLVRQGDKEKLAEAIVGMLSDKKLRDELRKKSLKRALEFDTNKIIKQWEFLEK